MSKKKKRIRNLESRTAHLLGNHEQQMRAIEHELAYLESMVRHYIALYEQNKATTTPTIVPSSEWPLSVPPGGLNVPFPSPFDTTTGTTLHEAMKYTDIGSTIGSDTAYEALRSMKLQEGDGR